MGWGSHGWRWKNQKLEELLPLNQARAPSIRYWRSNWLPNFKWRYPLVAKLQMTLAPLLSLYWYHLILFGSQLNKIVNLPFPWAFSFIVSFKTSLPELPCMWNFWAVTYTKFPSCYVHEIILYNAPFLYLIKRVVLSKNSFFVIIVSRIDTTCDNRSSHWYCWPRHRTTSRRNSYEYHCTVQFTQGRGLVISLVSR